MLPSDKDLAELCLAIYDPQSSSTVTWDRYDDGEDSDKICWGIKVIDDCDVLVFRGSKTLIDWHRDLNFWADPFCHSKIGPVHPGFLLGLGQILQEYQAHRNGNRKLMVTGHSLGAGRASVMCGLTIVAGIVPAARIVFGEPRPGFPQLGQLLSSIPESRSYRNGKFGTWEYDRVTDVPFKIGQLKYTHPTPLIDISAAPPQDDEWDVFSFHHMPLYVRALAEGSIQQPAQGSPEPEAAVEQADEAVSN